MTGHTTGSVMNLAGSGERSSGGGMTAVTVRSGRGLEDVRAQGMDMAVTVEISGMAGLAGFSAGITNGTTHQGAGCGIMTSGATAAGMNINISSERCNARGMTVSTEGH